MHKLRTFSFINIFGLAISLSACLLMLSIIMVQYSYDDFHADEDRIFRVNSIHHTGGVTPVTFATATPALIDFFEENAPEVENTMVLKKGFGVDFRANERIKHLSKSNVVFCADVVQYIDQIFFLSLSIF